MRHPTSRFTRLTGGASLVLAALLIQSSASSGAPARPQRLVLPPVPAHLGGGYLTGWNPTADVSRTVPRLRAHLTPSGLRVPDSNFAPATVSSSVDRVEDNTLADQDWFAYPLFHSKTYENLGRVTGYYQRADWMPSGGAVIFRYQGSVMLDNASAQAAQQDAVSTAQTKFSAQPSACQTQPASGPAQTIPNCTFVNLQGTDNATQQPVYIQNVAWAINYCLIETSVQYPPALGGNTPTGTQIGQTLSSITNAAAALAQQLCTSQGGPGPTPSSTVPPPPGATPTNTVPASSNPTPTPTRTSGAAATPTSTLSATSTATPTPRATATPTATTSTPVVVALEDVRVEKNGAKADLTSAPLLVVKGGQKVLLSIYVDVEQGSAGAPLSFKFSAKQKSTQLISRTIQDTVPATLPAQLRETVTAQPGKQGNYTFTGSVSAQGQSHKQATTFTVAGSTKHQCVTIAGAKYCS